MENTILKSSFTTLCDIFFAAKKQVILSVPNLQVEVADALVEVQNNGVDVKVFLEFSEQAYRQGFGEIEALNVLKENNVEIRNKQGFNVYFILYDNKGFFYFPKSFFYEKEGTAYDLIPMLDKQIAMMKVLFGLTDEESNAQMQEVIEDIGLDKISEVSNGIIHIDQQTVDQIAKKLKDDPVQKPILTRHLAVYKSKYQIIELEFKGANLSSKKVKLPKKALPFKDRELIEAIESNIRLFKVEKDSAFLKPFFDLKSEVEKIREDHLYRLKSRDKSIIKREELGKFNEKIAEVEKKMKKLNEKLSNEIQAEIAATRLKIRDNLLAFLLVNPPEEYTHYKDEVLKAEIANDVDKIIFSIHFPKAHEILEKMSIKQRPYDLTWEDLNDKEVLEDMVKKELITEDEKAYFDQKAFEAASTDQQLSLFMNT